MMDHAAMSSVIMFMGSSSVRIDQGIWGQKLNQTRTGGICASQTHARAGTG